jgi:hypothetical protein
MGLFIEVSDVEKGCKVIINLDTVMEVAPLKSGGCELAFPDAAAVSGKRIMKVEDSYSQFKQFALETVSVDDIAKKVKSLKSNKSPIEIPTL